jgi:hypothetical protein
MSRTNGGDIRFDDLEKEALRRIIHRMAEFTGIKVLTYTIMGNHFHILAEVPHQPTWLQRFAGPQGEAALFQHLRILYSKTYLSLLRQDLSQLRQLGMHAVAEARLTALKKRFCDLSLFVKEIKERFSRWYNKKHGRRGTLWMDRFKSILVEGKGQALRTMAAYIDLNPVRARLVTDPKDYRWSGYAEAIAGSRRAQRGLCRALGKPIDSWHSAEVASAYRSLLFDQGQQILDAQKQNTARPGITPGAARAVLASGGKLPVTQLVRLRVRYFTDGAILGSKAFIETLFHTQRSDFSPKRKHPAKPIPQSAIPLYTLRQLQLRPIG